MVSPRPSLLLPSPSFFRKCSVPGENRLACLLPPALPSPVPSPLHSGLDHQTLVCSQPFAASLHGWPRHLCSRREVLSLSSNLLSALVLWMAGGPHPQSGRLPPRLKSAQHEPCFCPALAAVLRHVSLCWAPLPPRVLPPLPPSCVLRLPGSTLGQPTRAHASATPTPEPASPAPARLWYHHDRPTLEEPEGQW